MAPLLDPNRIVNRILYGTDYDPDEVKLIYKPRCIQNLSEQIIDNTIKGLNEKRKDI